MMAACSSETGASEDGSYIDVRERSDYFMFSDETFEDLDNDHLPDEVTVDEDGASNGSPAKLGDTVIIKRYQGQELGVSAYGLERGNKAEEAMKDDDIYVEPDEGKEYLLIKTKSTAYDAGSEPLQDFGGIFNLTDGEKEFDVAGYIDLDDKVETLRTGDSQEHVLVYEVDKDTSQLFAVYDSLDNGEVWFSLN